MAQVLEHAELWCCRSAPAGDQVQSYHFPLMVQCADRVARLAVDRASLLLVVDGNISLRTRHKQVSLVGGDRLCLEVACASVVAKFIRDRRMQELHRLYPVYGFDANKGYATELHVRAIQQYGLCPEHRVKPARKAVTTWTAVGLQRNKSDQESHNG
jgi:ribonuclease HII